MANPAQLQKAFHKLIAAHARDLSVALHEHRVKLYPPEARKTLRSFSSTEAAKVIGVNDGYLRHLSNEGKGPQPEIGNNNRRLHRAARGEFSLGPMVMALLRLNGEAGRGPA